MPDKTEYAETTGRRGSFRHSAAGIGPLICVLLCWVLLPKVSVFRAVRSALRQLSSLTPLSPFICHVLQEFDCSSGILSSPFLEVFNCFRFITVAPLPRLASLSTALAVPLLTKLVLALTTSSVSSAP
ncbi:uncharacterized protein G2W53_020574 [Senna tora]|uniref:Transmembrane protein n=1 Tax=Senna tora TaxID=362788 RepID=A0A834TVP5_9FABA|nr:uncharacterized protein G2W53_020574 [Senna tora]